MSVEQRLYTDIATPCDGQLRREETVGLALQADYGAVTHVIFECEVEGVKRELLLRLIDS